MELDFIASGLHTSSISLWLYIWSGTQWIWDNTTLQLQNTSKLGQILSSEHVLILIHILHKARLMYEKAARQVSKHSNTRFKANDKSDSKVTTLSSFKVSQPLHALHTVI